MPRLAPPRPQRREQAVHRLLRRAKQRKIDGGQALVVHAPAIVHQLVHGGLHHARLGRRGLQRAGQVDPVEAQHHVRLLQRRHRTRPREHGSRGRVQGVRRRERGRRLHVGQHSRAQSLGQPHARRPRRLVPQHAAHQDQRAFGVAQRVHGLRERHRVRRGRQRRTVARDVRHRPRRRLRLLHGRVEVDVGRPARRGGGQQVGPQQGLHGGIGARGLVVPLHVAADERPLVPRGVDPVDPGAPLRRIHRPGRADHQHRHPVAPGVEDRHRRVHQADVAVHRRRHGPARHLGPPMRQRHRMLLVQAQQHARGRGCRGG